jgi:hypothetical protein
MVQKSNNALTIVVSSDGYRQVATTLSSSVQPIFFGNIICGGFIGSTTDLATGALYQYNPNSFYANLIPDHFGEVDSHYLEEFQIRYFAMMNHSQIALGANNPNDEYFGSLVNMLESNMETDTATRIIINALENSKGNQLAFGDELIDRFRRCN